MFRRLIKKLKPFKKTKKNITPSIHKRIAQEAQRANVEREAVQAIIELSALTYLKK